MKGIEHFWAIVLAAGEGERVRSLTSDGQGRHVPKQFWSLDGRDSLLRLAVRRAEILIPHQRIVPVVAAQHRRWWTEELSDLPPGNVVVQPRNRGTAVGILLPLAHILKKDPSARILVLPSDHVVTGEEALAKSIVAAARASLAAPRRVVLLGMVPGGDDRDYGWIMPAASSGAVEPRGVQAFVEKPDESTARVLARRGGLLNSFILVATGAALVNLFQLSIPHVVDRFLPRNPRFQPHSRALERLYKTLPTYDFSRDVLEASSDWLSVIPVPDCGWADIGIPSRLRPLLGSARASGTGLADALGT